MPTMVEGDPRFRTLVVSRHWRLPDDETGFAMRSLAAAASRFGAVDVLVPGNGHPRPDGGFDPVPIGARDERMDGHGADRSGRGPSVSEAPGSLPIWPDACHARWSPTERYDIALVEERDIGGAELLDHLLPSVPVSTVVSSATGATEAHATRREGAETDDGGSAGSVLVVGAGGSNGAGGPERVGCHVPAHALAAAARHVGMGFTDYILVLSDRGAGAGTGAARLTPLAAWVAARFPRRNVVVIEDAVASAWRARSLRGVVDVNTRMDLWRIIAHARVTVDLAPGRLLARECIESLRYGVPIVVPAGTAGERLAREGGGLWFEDPAELLGCISAMDDQPLRNHLGDSGRTMADEWYGTAARFVGRVHTGVAKITAEPPGPPEGGYAAPLPGSR